MSLSPVNVYSCQLGAWYRHTPESLSRADSDPRLLEVAESARRGECALGRETGVTTRVLSEVYTALMGATSTEQLREEMEKFTKQMGFDAFAYVMTVTAPSLRAQQYIIHGYPKEWAARYISRDYFKVDPLVLKAGGSVLPAIW